MRTVGNSGSSGISSDFDMATGGAKSMLVIQLPSILPPLNLQEAL
jgi:hypothetical protein